MVSSALRTPSADRSIAPFAIMRAQHGWEKIKAVTRRSTAKTATTAILCPIRAELVGLPAGNRRIASPPMEVLIHIARVARCAPVQRCVPMGHIAMLTPSADRSIVKLQVAHVSHIWAKVNPVKSRSSAKLATIATLGPRHVEAAGLPAWKRQIASLLMEVLMRIVRVARCVSVPG